MKWKHFPHLWSFARRLYLLPMMTSSNGNIFRVTGPLRGEFTGPGEFPTQRPVTRSFDVFFDVRLNKRLSKQSWGWWSETPSTSLWRHRNDLPVTNGLPTQRASSVELPYFPCCKNDEVVAKNSRICKFLRWRLKSLAPRLFTQTCVQA